MLLATTAVVAVVLGLWLAARRRAEFQSRPSRLAQAVQRGDLAEVDRLLKLEPQLAQGRKRRGFSSSHTPLQQAIAFGGTPQVVERILKERPDLNERSDDGDTALHLTARHRNYPYMARLLQLGADPNLVNQEGEAPLHLAAVFDGDGQFIKLLLDNGADPIPDKPSAVGCGDHGIALLSFLMCVCQFDAERQPKVPRCRSLRERRALASHVHAIATA